MNHTRRVLTVAPMPPEKAAYALARYSRSPDSIRDSIEWVRSHDSQKFLESFYFQYGHASIADLGHLTICFEKISELAATEIEDEQLWDGQARSSRYQNFGGAEFVVPPDLTETQAADYRRAGLQLLDTYGRIHAAMTHYYKEKLPRPAEMKPEAYERNISARAFDVARYCLFLGVPTGVGQVVSIRTLERQIRRMKASEYAELVELGEEMAMACSEPPACEWSDSCTEPLAPTLARFVDADHHFATSRRDLKIWADQNLRQVVTHFDEIDLIKPADSLTDIAATLLYTVTNRSYRSLYDLVGSWSTERQKEILDVALKSRTRRDEMLRQFRTAPYVYDIPMDLGAYRDMHRHRRCQQFRQEYRPVLGFATPAPVQEAGLQLEYQQALTSAMAAYTSLPSPASHYLLPFATKCRFLFKMDFAEAEYICRLRSGVKGHFSYREIAWRMKEKMVEIEPTLGPLIAATPPWVEDPLKR